MRVREDAPFWFRWLCSLLPEVHFSWTLERAEEAAWNDGWESCSVKIRGERFDRKAEKQPYACVGLCIHGHPLGECEGCAYTDALEASGRTH